MNRRYEKTTNKQRGVAIIEFTLALPFMVLAFVAIAEIGSAFYSYATLNKALIDAARFLSTGTANVGTTGKITAANLTTATNLIVYGNPAVQAKPLLSGASPVLTVVCVGSSYTSGGVLYCNQAGTYQTMRATATYAHAPILGTTLKNLSGVDLTINMTAETTMPFE
jgi:Flp pilus assembly protein TadG